jgi:cytoskeletal protein CcmA (bactofilin family)
MSAPSTLGPGLRINGTLTSAEDLVIEAEVAGTIEVPSHALTLGAGSRVSATIFARDLTIAGRFDGKVTATEIVEIRASGHVTGELATPTVVVAEGAFLRARVETRRVAAATRVARYRMERREQPAG